MNARPVLAELAAERHPQAPGRVVAQRVELFWSPAGVDVIEAGGRAWRIDELRPARVQLSRARRLVQPGWMQRVLGAPAQRTEHSLCAELRCGDGRRLALRAVCDDAERLVGLPPDGDLAARDAIDAELEPLLALLHTVLAHGGRLVHIAPLDAPATLSDLVPEPPDPRLDAALHARDEAVRDRDRLRARVAQLERELATRDRSLEWLSLENEKLAADARALEHRGLAAPARCRRCGHLGGRSDDTSDP